MVGTALRCARLKVRVVSPRLCPPHKPSDNRIELCRPGRAQREPGSPPAQGRQPRGSAWAAFLGRAAPLYPAGRRQPMGDMGLVGAGAGGRRGRTLIHAIAGTDGVTLAGAIEAKGAAVIGRDAGELAGLGPNNVKVETDAEPLLAKADALIDFTVPAATRAFAEIAARTGRVHLIGTTRLSAQADALIAPAGKRAPLVKPPNLSLPL